MGRISEQLIRSRSEHNEGLISTLEEVALHQQNIEKIEELGQLCRHLKILYLQNNLISKLENLHKLKELEYLNVAVNNITAVQNLQRCESLQKLDLTVNFVGLPGLPTLASLRGNVNLREMYLIGNPCVDWPGYRQYVVATLPQLQKLDGQAVKPSERILAVQALPELQEKLREDLRVMGIDMDAAAQVEDDSLLEGEEVAETGHVDEDGVLKRPWCPATRILEHRETEAMNREAEEKRRSAQSAKFGDNPPAQPLREDFPDVPDPDSVMQKNEGQWDFSLDETSDGRSIVLDVAIGKYIDSSLVKADVQPKFVRLLIKGKLLQLALPVEVLPDSSSAQRSKISGHLVVTMPKESPTQTSMDVTRMRPATGAMPHNENRSLGSNGHVKPVGVGAGRGGGKKATGSDFRSIVQKPKEAGEGGFLIREHMTALTLAGDDEDEDYVPPL